MKFAAGAVVLCLVLAYAAAEIGQGPANTWTYANSANPVMLTCRTTAATTGTSMIQWWEFGTNPAGAQISDQTIIMPSHPNRVRYALNLTLAGQYDLFIIGPVLSDGTYYQCRDVNASASDDFQKGAQLIVHESDPVCKTSVNSTTIVEGVRHTIECIMGYNASAGVEPLMSWTGPEPFIPAYNVGNNSVWSGIQFTAERSMQSGAYTVRTNYTSKGFDAPDSDNTIPNYDNQQRSAQLIINWPPKNMRYEPIQPTYSVGQTLVGFVDSLPAATYIWQGLWGPSAGRSWPTQSFQLDSSLIGNNTFRFRATNVINGAQNVADIFAYIFVNPIPTTPTPGPSTTTTVPPERANCNDLTGKWSAKDPTAILCISIDYTANGVITGQFKNGTDTYLSGIYGRIQLNSFDQGGFTVLNGLGTGVYSYVLECQACRGVETLILSSIQNSAQSIASCGSTGVSNTFADYYFTRVDTKPICV